MPNLNVITWNSTGETAQGATDLQGVINYLVANGWQPHVIVVQEANNAPGGAIYQMLAGLGGAYNGPPAHALEGGGPGGRGYLLTTHTSVAGQGTFARTNLGADGVLQHWITTNLSLTARQQAINDLANMRMPAMAALTFQGWNVPFLTWHAPRGPGHALVTTLPGGANADAFLFLQNSGVYQTLVWPGMNNLGVIAGDLNVTFAGMNTFTGLLALPRILPGWVGASGHLDHLDHIVCYPQAGQAVPAFPGAGHFPASGTHEILVSTVAW